MGDQNNHKQAKKLAKDLEKPKKIVGDIADWLDSFDKTRAFVKRAFHVFTNSADSMSKLLPAAVNTALNVGSLIAGLAGIPLAIFDTAQKWLKRSDTQKKIEKKAKLKPHTPPTLNNVESPILKEYETNQFKIHDLEAADAMGYKGAALVLSFFRTSIMISGGVAAVALFIKAGDLFWAQMGTVLGIAAMIVKVVIAVFALKKTQDKLTNVRKAETSYKEYFENIHANHVSFENLVSFLRNESVKEVSWDIFWSRVIDKAATEQDKKYLNDTVKGIFEANLPKDSNGQIKQIKKVNLEILEKALNGRYLSKDKEHVGYKNIYLALNRLPKERNLIEYFGKVAEATTTGISNSLKKISIDKSGKVSAQEFKEYLDMRDAYLKFKKKLQDKGVKFKEDIKLIVDHNRLEVFLSAQSKSFIEKINNSPLNVDKEFLAVIFKESLDTTQILKKPKKYLDLLTQHYKGKEPESVQELKMSLSFYIELLAEKQNHDKKYLKRSKEWEAAKITSEDLLEFDKFTKEYYALKAHITDNMKDSTRRTLLNSVFDRENKLEGKRVSKGITLALAMIGFITGFIISLFCPPTVVLWVMLIVPTVTLLWEIIDRFADFPWKTQLKEREVLPPLSDTKVTQWLNSKPNLEGKVIPVIKSQTTDIPESKFIGKVHGMSAKLNLYREIDKTDIAENNGVVVNNH